LDGDVETNISSDEKNHLSKSPKNLPISSKISQSPHNHQIPSEVSFRVSPFSFFQTNTLGAEQLFSLAMYMTGHVE
jgi:tRNA/tmRNA/rRNA uracil-C5-methylase (TrmA/RlmC/RlmD family)